MSQGGGQGWTRRELVGGMALFALVVGVPAAVATLESIEPADAPSDRQRALLREVAQLVIPRTETAGAGEAGVGDFVILALEHGLDGSRKPLVVTPAIRDLPLRTDGSLRHLDWLERELDRRTRGDFLSRPLDDRRAALAALDLASFPKDSPPPDPAPWRTIKALVLTGYYTSEAGASRELRFELVPGRWDPDVALRPGDKAWSSDWTAVEFG